MTNITLILGILLLVLGRKLFWLFVGAIGFVAGMHFASLYLSGYGENIVLIAGLVVGAFGILLALFVQKIAIVAGGFFGGGYLAISLLGTSLGQTTAQASWIPFIIGGIIGAILVSMLFEWALIVLSSLFGALLVVQFFHLDQSVATVVLILLAAAGVFIQARIKRRPQAAS